MTVRKYSNKKKGKYNKCHPVCDFIYCVHYKNKKYKKDYEIDIHLISLNTNFTALIIESSHLNTYSYIFKELEDKTCANDYCDKAPYKDCGCTPSGCIGRKKYAITNSAHEYSDQDYVYSKLYNTHVYFTFL